MLSQNDIANCLHSNFNTSTMENQNFNGEDLSREENTSLIDHQLEWGEHNPKLTDENFIDRPKKKLSDQNDLLDSASRPIDLSEEEPGRNRKGVREGANQLT